MMYWNPELVRKDIVMDDEYISRMMRTDQDWFKKREKRIDSPFMLEKVSQREKIKVGVMGLPYEATRELGETICNEMIDNLVDYVNLLKKTQEGEKMKVKWGVIGCGGIADRRTLPGMMLADNAELVAVMDANPEAAGRCKEKYNAKYAFDKVEDLLALDEIQAVYIASPVFCHKEQVEQAAKAKKQILLEKPMGLTTEEAAEIAAVCEHEGVKLGVAFMMRFHSYHQKMREIVSAGRIGEVVSARAQFTCWYPEMENCWRQNKKLSGGGAMLDMAIHSIDLIRYITGLEVDDATGFTGNQIFKYNVDDAGVGVYKMNNGALCVVEAAFNIPDDASVGKLEIYGTKGSMIAKGTLAQEEGGTLKVLALDSVGGYDAQQNRSTVAPVPVSVTFGNMYTKEIEAFGRAVLGEGEIPVTAEDAIRSQKAIEDVYKKNGISL